MLLFFIFAPHLSLLVRGLILQLYRPGALPITAAWPHKDEKPSRLCLCAAYIDPCIRLPSLPLLLCVHCTPQPAPCCAAESCPSISAHGRARAREPGPHKIKACSVTQSSAVDACSLPMAPSLQPWLPTPLHAALCGAHTGDPCVCPEALSALHIRAQPTTMNNRVLTDCSLR